MKVLFVTQYFYPENFRINDLAVSLLNMGHEVSVLTGMPNYPEGRYYKGYTSDGPFFEIWKGVKIYRVKNLPRRSGSLFLALNYLSFIFKGNEGAEALAEREQFDVIYAFGTSPITQALPAIRIRKKYNTPVILNVQDLWPDNVAVITGIKNPLIIKGLDILVDYIYNRCDIILGTSESFVKAIKDRKGLKDKNKVKYWPQYATIKKSDTVCDEFYNNNCFNIAFTGNIGQGQGLDNVISAMKECKDEKITLHLFGDGRAKSELMKYVEDNKLEASVKFHGSFPEEEIPAILNGADAALLSLNDNPIFEKTIPAKLQTYLACGCAVIGVVTGEAKKLIEDNEIGLCANSSDSNDIAKTFCEMSKLSKTDIAKMKDRAYSLSEEVFDKQQLISELVKMMEVLSK